MASRSIRIIDRDGKVIDELELSKLVRIKSDLTGALHFDQLKDGKWRLIYTENFGDLTNVERFEIVRED